MCEKMTDCVSPDVHEHTVNLARLDMPTAQTMREMAEQFRLFGDATRVSILWALAQGDMCVCDLARLLDCSQSLISHQLRLLRQAHLVRYDKKGKSSVYRLDDEHVWQIIEMGLRHVRENHEAGDEE